MKSARGFPWGPVVITSSGGGLVAAAIVVGHIGGPRGAQVACAFTGVAILLIGVLWWAVAIGTWQTTRGPWWTGTKEEAGEIDGVARLLAGFTRDQTPWASSSMRTARALSQDNSKLCARMDRTAYRASRRGRQHVPDELDAMWRSLVDGRDRLGELCGEMRAMVGQAMAAVPLEPVLTDEQIVSDLTAFADRIRALDVARRELEASLPPSAPAAVSGTQPADLVHLLRSRAPELAPPASTLLADSRRRQEEANRSIKQWKAQIEQLPIETPPDDRSRFVAARRESVSAMEQYLARIRQAEDEVLRAAQHLAPPPSPPPPTPKDYERASVDAAEGMINALKEMRRRAADPGG